MRRKKQPTRRNRTKNPTAQVLDELCLARGIDAEAIRRETRREIERYERERRYEREKFKAP